MKRNVYYLIFVMLCSLLLVGCASDKKIRVLDDSLSIYSSAIRWGDFKGATRFYKTPDLFGHVDFGLLKSIRVTAYEETGRVMTKDGNRLKQSVVLRFYNTSVGKVREYIDNQIWEFDEQRQIWLLASPMPDFQ